MPSGEVVFAGGDADDPWKIEVELDKFSDEEGDVVSLYVENSVELSVNGERKESGLAALLPDEARQLATALNDLADKCEQRRAAA